MADGTFITATGLNTASKPSTKVCAPPGGRSSDIFGPDNSVPHTVNEGQKKRNTSTIFEMPPANTSNITGKNTGNHGNKTNNNNNMNNMNSKSSNVKKSVVDSMNEVVNGPPGVENAKAPGGGRSSTKVMAPPGGQTSISFG